MLSNIKIKVNRENAQKSTGPRTPEGKARVARNAVTHGLRSRGAVMLVENLEDYKQLSSDFYNEWLPATPTEEDLVEQMVVNKWKLARYEAVETQACMQSSLVLLAFHDAATFKTEKGTLKLPDTVDKRETQAELSLVRISQQIARVERSYFRALETLRRLQDDRSRQQSRPPQPNQADPPPATKAVPKVRTAGASAQAAVALIPLALHRKDGGGA